MRFKVTSGALRATDPCYLSDFDHVAMTIPNVKNGVYSVNAEYSDEGVWGTRIKSLMAVHSDISFHYVKDFPEWHYLARLGVDSGQFGFFDFLTFKNLGPEREYNSPGFYKECCDITLKSDRGIVGSYENPFGCVSSSGYGDGSYPVYVLYNADKNVIAVKVEFFDNFEEIQDEEENYYEDLNTN